MILRLTVALAVLVMPMLTALPYPVPTTVGAVKAWAHGGGGGDLCPGDPNKDDPGDCGCGNPDIHSDGDGKADCIDDCPNDSSKITDVDTDSDGVLDCNDDDDDNDGTPDINDDCPTDPTKTTDVDSDGDGTLDCNDNCKSDANKVDPGQCGCGVSDNDSDGDGTADCNDDDDDNDGEPDSSDGCPNDSDKTAPGVCGCGVADVDDDLDGSFACNDCDDDDGARYPGNAEICDGIDNNCDNVLPPDEHDGDGDGKIDCDDPCPLDNPDDADGNGKCGDCLAEQASLQQAEMILSQLANDLDQLKKSIGVANSNSIIAFTKLGKIRIERKACAKLKKASVILVCLANTQLKYIIALQDLKIAEDTLKSLKTQLPILEALVDKARKKVEAATKALKDCQAVK